MPAVRTTMAAVSCVAVLAGCGPGI
ncbi:MAG: hypothetical protein JWM05_3345, partial [Acidimicrobiales bacterium]|nr:hypothetical protein [Acidimicrobiales bacterium]